MTLVATPHTVNMINGIANGTIGVITLSQHQQHTLHNFKANKVPEDNAVISIPRIITEQSAYGSLTPTANK